MSELSKKARNRTRVQMILTMLVICLLYTSDAADEL